MKSTLTGVADARLLQQRLGLGDVALAAPGNAFW